MLHKYLIVGIAVSLFGLSALAAQDEYARIELKGMLQENPDQSLAINSGGGLYDLKFASAKEADLRPIAQNLRGGVVIVDGYLQVENAGTGHPRLVVFADRIQSGQSANVQYVAPPPPTVIHEYEYDDRDRLDLPGVHVHW